jgi:hypothetical protein
MELVIAIGIGFFAYVLLRSTTKMSEALDRLTAEVSETKSAVDSAVALISGLAQQIRDNVSEDALNALADSLDAQQAELAEAVTNNTAVPSPGTTA